MRRHRIRPQRRRTGGRQQHRVRPQLPAPGRLPARRAVRHHRQGRHDAARLVSVRADRGQQCRSRLTAALQVHERHRHRYEFNNQYRQQFAAHGIGRHRHQPGRQAGRGDRIAAIIRGSWRCSAIRSSSRSRPRRIRCFAASSNPASAGAKGKKNLKRREDRWRSNRLSRKRRFECAIRKSSFTNATAGWLAC